MNLKSLLILVLVCWLPLSTFAQDATLERRLNYWVKQGNVLVADQSRILFQYRTSEPLVPASILKYATALAAYHRLGGDHHFQTKVFLRAGQDLIIQGQGDPQFVSEEITRLATQLRESSQVPKRLRHLILDTSVFPGDLKIPGSGNSLNPYDANNGALVVNFNTIHVRKNKDGSIQSAEPQTPLTPYARERAKDLKSGRHRINISQNPQDSLRYAGELIHALFARQGVVFEGNVLQGVTQSEDQLVLRFQNSRTMNQTITSMMVYSNNYIANQLLLQMGLKANGAPANLEGSLKVMNEFLARDLQIPAAEFTLTEASGLSRENRITPTAILTLLRHYQPYRTTLPQHKGYFVKTGTLTGVYSMAGYLNHPETGEDNLYFVIMLNQKSNVRNKVFDLIEEALPRLVKE